MILFTILLIYIASAYIVNNIGAECDGQSLKDYFLEVYNDDKLDAIILIITLPLLAGYMLYDKYKEHPCF